MPHFSYKARKADGSIVDGAVEARDLGAASERLRGQALVLLEVGPKTGPIEIVSALFRKRGQVTAKDLTLFSRQLATMVSAGVPIVQSLAILARQTKNPEFKSVLTGVRADVESGLSISEALKRRPEAFPDFYVSMVAAGELGGILETILERLTVYLENLESLKGKVKSALVYPAVVLSLCGAVTVFLMVFVIPTFQNIFASLGARLPPLTQLLIDASAVLKRYFPLIALGGFGSWRGFNQVYRTVSGRRTIDSQALRLPIFGELLRNVALSKFARTLGTLVRSGVPMLQALDTVAATVGNVVIAQAVLAARDSVREGGHLSDPLIKSGLFPEMATSMISVGEETGSLDIMLSKIADFADQEVDVVVKGLTSVIEPIVMVIMGLIIGTIVIAMFWPLFNLPGAVEG